MSDRQPHYLKAVSATALPRDHAVIDVETTAVPGVSTGHQHWRLAAAEFFHGDARRGWSEPTVAGYVKPFSLWADINARVKPERRLVVWSHNLSFDLRASAALHYLPALGFELEGLALDSMAGWARFSRDGGSLLFCDLLSFFPARLSKIAIAMGVPPSPTATATDSDIEWAERCRSDVAITGRAVRRLLDIIEEDDLGPWKPTGAGQSHSAWRRRWLTHRPLVHDRVDVLTAERTASWTGRCEAWRHGQLGPGHFTEWDMSLAYCQIAADCDVPTVLVGEAPGAGLDQLLADTGRLATLAHVTVSTEVPVVPAQLDDHMAWPVGTFDTWLWDPELALLAEHADQVTVHQAFQYRKTPALADYASWIIDGIAAADAADDLLRRMMLKHWARAMVGRCALRYRAWQEWGVADQPDLSLGAHLDWNTGEETEMLQVGTRLSVLSDMQEAPDSLPQIPGWIMSECRRRLWHMMSTAGLDHVIYVDTDCVITDPAGSARLRDWVDSAAAWPVHVKGVHTHLNIDGPRMMDVGGERRRSGIPLGARHDDRGGLVGSVFLSLRESLLRGDATTVQLVDRHYQTGGLDRRRNHHPGGVTSAKRIPSP